MIKLHPPFRVRWEAYHAGAYPVCPPTCVNSTHGCIRSKRARDLVAARPRRGQWTAPLLSILYPHGGRAGRAQRAQFTHVLMTDASELGVAQGGAVAPYVARAHGGQGGCGHAGEGA